MAESTYNMLEIAAGTGMLGVGVSIALESIGIRTATVCGIEWETCAASAFMAGVAHETGRRPAVWDDARSFVSRRYRCPGTGSGVNIIAAGYPCQPFSTAGRRAGATDARHLWPACRRIIARLKPSLIVLENVDGHVTLGLWKVLRDCERIGYRVTVGVYSSEEVGAPHLRKRVFVVGVANTERQHLHHAEAGRQYFAGRAAAGGAGCELGDGQSNGRKQWRAESAWEQGRHDATERSGEMADGIGEGLERRPGVGDALPNDGATAGGRPIFPPVRTDYRRWAELAAGGLEPTLMPSVESGVSVVADGVASSADLLRLGGNGVNPLCAAWAVTNLLACLMEPVAGPCAQQTFFSD